ncbi:hypothetical protein [Streptomyces sp. NPDC058308]|uniref:hypothetical protein n=1 Tax=Streptomyces sp. NPDC058308 TaxID=3346440 RepID=UPI0036E7BA54
MAAEVGLRRKWRVAMPVRVVASCLSLVFLFFSGSAIWPWFTGAPAAEYMLACPVFLGGAIAGFLYSFGTSVVVTEDRLIVRNLGLVDSIPLQEIQSVEAGYSGLTITASGGRVLRGRAVEKPNYARWLGRRTRADRVVQDIRFASGLTAGRPGRGRAPG